MEEPAVDEDVVDAEVVSDDEGMGKDLATVTASAPTLFHTDDPALVIEKAGAVATLLKDILQKQGLTTRIGTRDHVQVEGWQTTGSMLGVFPVESWTRPVDGPEDHDAKKGPWGYESRYEARTITGAIVGAGVARCTRSEGMWRNRDDYALLSMAQTRATSKALKGPLGWIVALAGYTATPAEEMPPDEPPPPFGPGASGALSNSTHIAIMTLLGDDAEPVHLIEKVAQDAGGYLPRIAALPNGAHTAAI